MDDTGFDRESACRTLTQSMRILERCIKETEEFLDHFFRDEKKKIAENWEEVREVVAELKSLIHVEPKSLFRDKYYTVNRLASLVDKQAALLSGNPFEMVKMANQLATLNGKTIAMQAQVDKMSGGVPADPVANIFEELAADQIGQIYEWIEENRRIMRALEND